jgi:hypothetical protein
MLEVKTFLLKEAMNAVKNEIPQWCQPLQDFITN